MGKFGKWIGGGLGWVVGGPLGAIIGFGIGSLFDKTEFAKAGSQTGTTTGGFAMTLLVLIGAVMNADGKVLKSELTYVKKYLIQQFGEDSAAEALQMLKKILEQDIPIESVGHQIRQNLDYASRLQLIHLLFGVALADGSVDNAELNVIVSIAGAMGVSSKDFESIKSMFIANVDSSYTILEIDRSASDDDVKKAYRKMAVKYHPDKVSHLGEDFQKQAKEKFQKVSEAYENIKKERGIN